MKNIIIISLLFSVITTAGIFGDTDEERKIASKRMGTILYGKDKTLNLRKENYQIKKLLKNKHINYEYPLKTMRAKNDIKEVNNRFTITEEEEIKILKKENEELKRLMTVNYISFDKKESIKDNKNKPVINIEITESKKIDIEKAIKEVK